MRQLKIATQITNRDSQAVEKYLQEISKISMITPEEETTLALKIHMGDQRALDKLVQSNLSFVVSAISRPNLTPETRSNGSGSQKWSRNHLDLAP